MKPASAKQKGRILQQDIRDKILEKFPELQEDDVTSRSMGCGGEDVLLSPKARVFFPFSCECKNQESMSIWQALKQAEANAKNNIPLLIFKRNRTKIYCALSFDDLLKLIK